MTIAELIEYLTENLTDEQKAMDADVLSDSGAVYTINTILIVAVGEGDTEVGQPLLFVY